MPDADRLLRSLFDIPKEDRPQAMLTMLQPLFVQVMQLTTAHIRDNDVLSLFHAMRNLMSVGMLGMMDALERTEHPAADEFATVMRSVGSFIEHLHLLLLKQDEDAHWDEKEWNHGLYHIHQDLYNVLTEAMDYDEIRAMAADHGIHLPKIEIEEMPTPTKTTLSA